MERPVKRACHLPLLVSLERSGWRSRGPHRRLITLIFADRAELAVMVVVRRELPRTRVAGPARGLSRRSAEDPPSRVPPDRRPLCSSSVIVVVLAVRAALGGGGRTACRVLLDVHADGPDKPEELAGDRRDSVPTSVTTLTADSLAIPRSACSPAITARTGAGVRSAAVAIARSKRAMRSAAWSISVR